MSEISGGIQAPESSPSKVFKRDDGSYVSSKRTQKILNITEELAFVKLDAQGKLNEELATPQEILSVDLKEVADNSQDAALDSEEYAVICAPTVLTKLASLSGHDDDSKSEHWKGRFAVEMGQISHVVVESLAAPEAAIQLALAFKNAINLPKVTQTNPTV